MTIISILGFCLLTILFIGGIVMKVIGDLTDEESYQGIGRGILIAFLAVLPYIVTANSLTGAA